MTVFEVLLLGHVLGDWLFQTEWQAVNKDHNWRALLTHVLVYHIVIVVLLGLKMGFSYTPIYPVVIFLAIFHVLLDRQQFVRWLMKILRITVDRQPERWLSVAVDQSLHFVLLAVATIYLVGL